MVDVGKYTDTIYMDGKGITLGLLTTYVTMGSHPPKHRQNPSDVPSLLETLAIRQWSQRSGLDFTRFSPRKNQEKSGVKQTLNGLVNRKLEVILL